VWVLLGLAREMSQDAVERSLIAGLVLSLGAMELFFGYIENYTLMTVGVLIYLWLALRTLRGESALVWPATALALTHAFHPATIVLAPSLVYLFRTVVHAAHDATTEENVTAPLGSVSDRARPGMERGGSIGDRPQPAERAILRTDVDAGRDAMVDENVAGCHPRMGRECTNTPRHSWIRGVFVDGRSPIFRSEGARAIVSIAVPYLLVLVGVLALMTAGGHGIDALLGADFPGGGDRRWLVPLFQVTTKWEHYTMFSLGHLLDVVNEQLLVAPAILPGLILVAIFAWRRLPLRDPAFRFLALCAGLYLLLVLTWNPDYGGQRDWDLFAPAAVPTALLLGYVLPRVLPERGALKAAGWALIAAQVYHLIAWVYQNTQPWSWS
jgi:hypothetical protein